jgi:two-component system OmpR family sensor kinase
VTSLLVEARQMRLGRRSLTARIVTGVVALVVLLVLAIGGATYFALRSFLLNRLDQQLSSSAVQNARYFDNCLEQLRFPHEPYQQAQCTVGPPPIQHEWLVVLSRDSSPFLAPRPGLQNLTALDLSARQQVTATRQVGQPFYVESGGAKLRVMSQRAGDYVVVTGLSTAEASRTLRRLFFLEVSIGGGAVAVAVLATSWGVQRSLRHLYQVTGTAQEVAAELSPEGRGLDRRVPVTEEGTEVGQLAESMNTLLGAVETQFAARLESEHRMRQFLADASHELRTPLTSIRGYAELARMQRAAGAADEDNLARIESEGTRMSRLIEDLLLLARGDADPASQAAQFDDVGVESLLDDVVRNARAAFPEREIHLQVAGAPTVWGDRDQLMRGVGNLVTNAAVHTAEDRPITVRGFVDAASASGVTIQVIDGGPGLPPDAAAHVFERFWRADKARSRARGGTGLGMSIVAAIVRLHGGSVRFDSSVERGSTVTMWLPLRPPQPAPAAAS